MKNIDFTLQLAVEQARQALADFDYDTRKNRAALVQAQDDANKAVQDAQNAVKIDELNTAITEKANPTPGVIATP